MERVKISKRILDRLIRAKLVQLDDCLGVNALPVVVRERTGKDCNWTIPGWTGDAHIVGRCRDRMTTYIDFLRGQFNISD